MTQRHVPVGRISALLALAVGAYLVMHGHAPPRWHTLRPGVEFTTVRGEPWCRRGSAEIAVLRLDPALARLRVRHFSLTRSKTPMNIVEWQRSTGAIAVFNAGQFYPDYDYMGLLVCSGHVVSDELHADFKAALVAGPYAAHVLDLTRQPLDPAHPGWDEVAQSFMLLDESGDERVRKSDHIANRTVVAEDAKGRVLVITSEGGYTLWDFAQLLRKAQLGVSHAMSMDGGREAELCVSTDKFHYASFGHWEPPKESEMPGAKVTLPAVVTVEVSEAITPPKESKTSAPR
jgi:hypothetical protein